VRASASPEAGAFGSALPGRQRHPRHRHGRRGVDDQVNRSQSERAAQHPDRHRTSDHRHRHERAAEAEGHHRQRQRRQHRPQQYAQERLLDRRQQ
jgi:hypothetical protein